MLKVDRGVPADLHAVPHRARQIEAAGYDGVWTGEINHDPFLPLLLAAEHTERIEIGTSIAVAFARSPMTLANLGWDLNAYSEGRFILGLGTQVQAHIEKRFSMPWSRPVARMREYIGALHAIWSAWHDGNKLRFEGDFYTHKIMTPMFTPEPQPHGMPKVFVAGVGEAMTEMAGEVADGLLAHAFTTSRYLHEITLPALNRGLQRSGRARSDFAVSCPVFVVTGGDDSEIAASAAATRKQIAFYASTPAYRPVLECHGWGELQSELRELSLAGEWDEMGARITDDILAAFAVVAPLDDVADGLRARCHGAIDRVLPALPSSLGDDVVADILDALRRPARA